jgi:hypothetical protein
MKKFFVILSLLVVSFAAGGQSSLPPALPDESDTSGWTDDTMFWAGLTLGFVYGGIAFTFRMVREGANKENPMI